MISYSKVVIVCLACSIGIGMFLLAGLVDDSWPTSPKQMQIGPYLFDLPVWWDETDASLPTNHEKSEDIERHVRMNFGAAVGTAENWQEALKTWALAEAELKDSFPVYIAHCYKTGDRHEKAAQVFSDLCKLAHTQGDNRQWYECYLSYNAGKSYLKIGDVQNAKIWLSRSADFTDREVNKTDRNAIRYYSNQSKNILDKMVATSPGGTSAP